MTASWAASSRFFSGVSERRRNHNESRILPFCLQEELDVPKNLRGKKKKSCLDSQGVADECRMLMNAMKMILKWKTISI